MSGTTAYPQSLESLMRIWTGVLLAAVAATACKDGPTSPKQVAVAGTMQSDRSTGDTPNYNLEVILRGDGFGHVKFRQPGNDDAHTVFLGVWVRDLEPSTSYQLERAVDTTLDGDCTSTKWLTLGNGVLPHSIVTDENGTGTADLFRTFPSSIVGTTFDIHFHVIREDTKAVVLTSECYQFTVR
jgi:hypothetical protein